MLTQMRPGRQRRSVHGVGATRPAESLSPPPHTRPSPTKGTHSCDSELMLGRHQRSVGQSRCVSHRYDGGGGGGGELSHGSCASRRTKKLSVVTYSERTSSRLTSVSVQTSEGRGTSFAPRMLMRAGSVRMRESPGGDATGELTAGGGGGGDISALRSGGGGGGGGAGGGDWGGTGGGAVQASSTSAASELTTSEAMWPAKSTCVDMQWPSRPRNASIEPRHRRQSAGRAYQLARTLESPGEPPHASIKRLSTDRQCVSRQLGSVEVAQCSPPNSGSGGSGGGGGGGGDGGGGAGDGEGGGDGGEGGGGDARGLGGGFGAGRPGTAGVLVSARMWHETPAEASNVLVTTSLRKKQLPTPTWLAVGPPE